MKNGEKMETKTRFLNLSLKNFSFFTILSLLMIIFGLIHYLYFNLRYGDTWTDIGIYSFTIMFVFPGVIGLIISLMDKKEEED